MADPLSIAASVAGLITLAASTAKLVKTVGDRYTNQVSMSVKNNVQTLEATLRNITEGMWVYDFTRPGEENLRQPINACAQTLRELGRNFRKLHPEESSGPHIESSWGSGFSLKRFQQKLTRPETLKEIERLQAVLESQKMNLLIAMQTFSGASQFEMLVMIFNIVQELTNSKEPTQSAYTPADYDYDGNVYNMLDTNDDHLQPLSLAQAFPSFEDWLSTWTASGEDQDDFTISTNGEPLNGLLSAESTAKPEDATAKLIIEGLKRRGSSEWTTKEIIAPRHTQLYDITSLLNSQGYEYICGFTNAVDGTEFAPFLPWNTSLVVITDGSSSYNVETGLRINQNESLVEFYNGCLRKVINPSSSASPSIEKRGSAITVQDTLDPRIDTSITFQRTLRLPEDGKSHGTSAFLGSFPLFAAEEHASKLPPAMKSKGGIFFPMFQRESLAIAFSPRNEHVRAGYLEHDKDRFAIKVYAGSINCLSGRTASETDDDIRTDYIVSPGQARLDGYRSADGSIRQFVAMPLGWNYSAEHQITGHEFIGGIQLKIACRLRDHVEFRSLNNLWHFGKALRLKSTAEDLGFKVGDVLAMTDFDPEIKILDDSELTLTDSTRWSNQPLLSPMESIHHRISTVQDILQKANRRVGESNDGIRLRAVPPILVHFKIIVGERTPVEESLRCSPYLDLGSLATQRLHHHHLDCGHCNKCTKSGKYNVNPEWKFDTESPVSTSGISWPAQHRPLESLPAPYSLVDGQLRIVCTQISPGYIYSDRYDRQAFDHAPLPDWQMALGAGATLLQRIYKNSSHQCWDWRNSRLINFQILNTVAFQSVTGIPAWTPVSLKDYQEKQLTLRVPLSLQQDLPETVPESAMPELHGIGSLDRETSVQVRGKRLMVLCPQCEINMCNLA
ncbi:integral membrane protein [Colletotrichum tofieldiae]|nr:integral membrane protein [Colletotrichum tofieldiae]